MPSFEIYSILAIFIMGLATFLTRGIPFLLLRKYQENKHLLFIGRLLPPAVMVILIGYCLKDVIVTKPAYGIPEFTSIVVVSLIHIWKRNALLSIFVGTLIYLFLLITLS